jgi:hypothetical protein
VKFFLPVVLAAVSALAIRPPQQTTTAITTDTPPVPAIHQLFAAGETLDYNLTWLRISGGAARMTISGADDGTYRITSVAKSGAAVARFVKVKDEIETTVARSTFTTLRFIKRHDEKGEKKEDITTVEDGVATRRRKKVKSVRVPTPVYDPISVIYYLRTLNLSPGATHELALVSDAKLYNVHVHVRRRERIQTPAGTFDTVMVEPSMESGGVNREERLFVWYTDDERRIPVRIRTEIKVGAITATLTGITSGVDAVEPPPARGQ